MNNFAISSTGIGEALMRSASALSGAGNTLEESIGLITAANAVVQNPQQVGTAMKTLTMYLRAAKTEAEAAGESTEGMASSVSELRNELLSLTGVDIMLDENNFKSTFQILKELSEVWDDLSDVSRANVTELIGGKRNANVIQAIMKNFEDAEEAAKTASESTGSALRENEKYLESVSGKIDVMKAAWETFSMSVMGSGVIKFFVDLGTALLNVGTSLSDMNLLIPAISAIVVAFSRMNSMKQVSGIASQISALINSGAGMETVVSSVSASVMGLSSAQKALLAAQLESIPGVAALTAEMKEQLLTSLELKAANDGLAASSNPAVSGIGKLWAGFRGLPIAGQISAVIGVLSLVVPLVQSFVGRAEEAREAAIDAASEISSAFSDAQDTYDSNLKKIDGLKSRYEELSKGVDSNGKNVSLTAAEYEEYLSIIDQIIGISPSVVQGYDEEGNAIVRYKNLIQDAIGAQEDYIDNARKMRMAGADDTYKGAIASYKKARDAVEDAQIDIAESLDIRGEYDKASGMAEAFTKIGLGEFIYEDFSGYKYIDTIRMEDEQLATLVQHRSELLDTLRGMQTTDYDGQLIPMFSEGFLGELNSQILQLENDLGGLDDTYGDVVATIMDESAEKDWYPQIPLDALDEFESGISGITANAMREGKTLSELREEVDLFGRSFAEAYSGSAVQDIIKMSDGLKDGSVSLEAYNAAVASFANANDSTSPAVAALVDYLYSLSNSAQEAAPAMEEATAAATDMEEALSDLSKGYELLDQAKSEMRDYGGLSADTIKGMSDMLGDDEHISDYLTTENGLIQLNVEAWQERARAKAEANKEFAESQIAALEDENAQLAARNEKLMQNSDAPGAADKINANEAKIKENEEAIASYTDELLIYDQTLRDIEGNPLDLSGVFKDAGDVADKAGSITDALEQLRSGTALTQAELMELAEKDPHLLTIPNLFDMTSVEDQTNALQQIRDEYETQYDEIIQAQIDAVTKARDEIKAAGGDTSLYDAVIGNLEQWKGQSIDDVIGNTDKLYDLADAIDAIKTASDFREDLFSGDYSPLEMLDSIIKMADEIEGLDLKDFMSFDAENGITFDEDAPVRYAEAVIDAAMANSDLEATFPGITDWLKKYAAASDEAAEATTGLSDALDIVGNVSDFLTDIESGTADPLDMISQAIDMAEELNKIMAGSEGWENVDWTHFLSGFSEADGFEWNKQAMRAFSDAAVDAAFKGTSLENTEEGRAIIQNIKDRAAATSELADETEKLDAAMTAISDASDFLTNIANGEGSPLEMVRSAAEMAKQLNEMHIGDSDWAKLDWTHFMKGWDAVNGIQWNADAVRAYSDAMVDAWVAEQGITDANLIQYFKDLAAAEMEAANRAEQMANAHTRARGAIDARTKTDPTTELTYDSYQDLIEIDARYAQAVEYQNGIMTLNAQKYEEVTSAVLAETKAQAEAAAAAILTSDEYTTLISKVGHLSDAERARLNDLNADIMGYATLVNELESATSAYQRFINASGDIEPGRYSAAKEALDVINGTMFDKKSDLYGRIGREQYKAAIDFVLAPNTEPTEEAIKEAYKRCERYFTDGSKGVERFVDDLIEHGLADETGRLQDVSIAQISDVLGIGEDAVRAMIDNWNTYLDENDQIEVKPSVDADLSGITSGYDLIQSYVARGQQGVSELVSNWASSGFITDTGMLSMPIKQMADKLGVSVEYLQDVIDQINYLSPEGEQISLPDVDSSGIEGAGTSAATAEEQIASLQAQVTELQTLLTGLGTMEITLDTTAASEALTALSAQVTAIVTQLSSAAVSGGEGGEDTDVSSSSTVEVDTASAQESVATLQAAVDTLAASLTNLNPASTSVDVSGALESVASLQTALNNILTTLKSLNPGTVTLDTGRAVAAAGAVSSALSAILNRLASIRANSSITIHINTVETRSVVTKSAGYAIASGTMAGASMASGTGGMAAAKGRNLMAGGKTLVGELGREIVVDPNTGRWYTVGDNGAEFVYLPRGAIVFNHLQTEALLGSHSFAGRGQALMTGNAAASTSTSKKSSGSSWLKKAADAVKNTVKKVTDTVKKAASAVQNAAKKATSSPTVRKGPTRPLKSSDTATGGAKPKTSSSSKKSSGGGSSKSSGGGSSSKKSSSSSESALEKLKKQYEEVNEQYEHLIEHQEHLYNVAERSYDFEGMEKSLSEQAKLYKQIMENSQKAVDAMKAKGAKDTDKELQEMEQAYWDAYDNMNEKLDEINDLYVGALNDKIDEIQKAYSNLSKALSEMNDSGGISVDTFQALLENGLQYLHLLQNQDGQYEINKDSINALIAAEKERLAIESALSYLNEISEALTGKNAEKLAELVDSTGKISDSTWDMVMAQLEALKNLGLTSDQYNIIVQNVEALRDLSGKVNTNITDTAKSLKDQYDNELDALDRILDLTMDLIKYETNERIDAIEDEIDAFQKIVDLKKESLGMTKDENEYQKGVSDRIKEIAELQAKIDQLALDDSRAAQAERLKLMEELADKQDDLSEYQSDHAYDTQIDVLDKLAEDYEESRQKEIEELEERISSEEKLYQLAVERIREKWDTLYADLIEWNTEAGSILNSEITDNWDIALKAAQRYGSYLEALKQVYQGLVDAGGKNESLKYKVENLPEYHSGGIVGNAGSINAHEAIAVLEKGEVVLDKQKRKGLFKIINFQQMLSERLGTVIGNVGSAFSGMMQMPSIAGSVASGVVGSPATMVFNPQIDVQLNHNGTMTDSDAERYGRKIADTTIDRLYSAFERKGVSGIFGGKLKQ